MMVNVPGEFSPHIHTDYPSWNKIIFEEWLYRQPIIQSEREYLPVFWCSYFVNNDYGNDAVALGRLQRFIDELDRNKKYWTVTQYDDLCLVDFKDLDIVVFGMSQRLPSQKLDYILPLIGQPYPKIETPKKYKASFVGTITHPVRKIIAGLTFPEYYISTIPHQPFEYNEILAQSVFAIAPVGYGRTSFRAFEALVQGAIPVMIGDVIEPMGIDANTYAIKIAEHNCIIIEEILNSFSPDEIKNIQNEGQRLINSAFTYEGCRNYIIQKLTNDR